jgi:hypothetical protein
LLPLYPQGLIAAKKDGKDLSFITDPVDGRLGGAPAANAMTEAHNKVNPLHQLGSIPENSKEKDSKHQSTPEHHRNVSDHHHHHQHHKEKALERAANIVVDMTNKGAATGDSAATPTRRRSTLDTIKLYMKGEEPGRKSTMEIHEDTKRSNNKYEVKVMLFYGFYLGFFTYNMLVTRNHQEIFYAGQAIVDQIVNEQFPADYGNGNLCYNDVTTPIEFYNYMEGVVADKLFNGANTYDGDGNYPKYDPHNEYSIWNDRFMIKGFNKLVGAIRWSQLRFQPQKCEERQLPVIWGNETIRCYSLDRFSNIVAPENDAEVWGYPVPIYKHQGYTAEEKGETLSYRSPTTNVAYSAPTHYLHMPTNITTAKARDFIKALRATKWIDLSTAVVFVDYNFYNPSLDMSITFRHIIEFVPSGGVFTNYEVALANVYNVLGVSGYFSDVIVMLMTIFFAVDGISSFLRRIRIKKSLFDAFELSLVTDFFQYTIVFYYFVLRISADQKFEIDDQKKHFDPTQYYALRTVMMSLAQAQSIASISIFFAWIKLFKYIGYIPAFQLMIETFSEARNQIANFLLVMSLVFFACAQSFFLCFGSTMFQYRNLSASTYSLLRMAMGEFEFAPMMRSQPILAPILFVVFIFLVVFALLNMFVAIISEAFETTKENREAMEALDIKGISGEIFEAAEELIFYDVLFRIPFVGEYMKMGYNWIRGRVQLAANATQSGLLNTMNAVGDLADKVGDKIGELDHIALGKLGFDDDKDGDVTADEVFKALDIKGDGIIPIEKAAVALTSLGVKNSMEACRNIDKVRPSAITLFHFLCLCVLMGN